MPDLSATLSTGSTRLCRCWQLTRSDGAVYGFTDHDRPISFDGVNFKPSGAMTASEASAATGLAPDEMDAAGALSSDAITEADLAAGLWDGADVRAYDVDWSAPSTRALVGRYRLGMIERGPLAFRAELRSLAAQADREEGRTHSSLCDVARLGDARCGVDLTAHRATGTVTAVDGVALTVSTGSSLDPRRLARGVLTVLDQGLAGQEFDIRGGAPVTGGFAVTLWRGPSSGFPVGASVTMTAGCDRSYATCRGTFNNALNFRGFPHMPGPDVTGEFALVGSEGNTGGSRF